MGIRTSDVSGELLAGSLLIDHDIELNLLTIYKTTTINTETSKKICTH